MKRTFEQKVGTWIDENKPAIIGFVIGLAIGVLL